jgi:dTDP-4-dehydrorhamnose reductase
VAPIKDVKWIILGGEGQLGLAMRSELSNSHVPCISLTRSQLDITNQKEIELLIHSERPTVVFNAAAWTDVDAAESNTKEVQKVNAIGPKLIAEACAKIDAVNVQVSTDYVFSGNSKVPWSVDAELSPISVYGSSKAEGERLAWAANPKGTYIVRTAWLYSPWGKNFVKTMARIALDESRKVEVVTDQVGQPTSAIDLSSQIYKLVDFGLNPGIYHGTNSGQATWFELAHEVFRLTGEDVGRLVPIDSRQIHLRAKRPVYSVLSHDDWLTQGMKPMRNWKDALAEILPTILETIKRG